MLRPLCHNSWGGAEDFSRFKCALDCADENVTIHPGDTLKLSVTSASPLFEEGFRKKREETAQCLVLYLRREKNKPATPEDLPSFKVASTLNKTTLLCIIA